MIESTVMKTCDESHNTFFSDPLSGVIFDLDNTLVTSSLNFIEIKKAINCPTEMDVLKYVDSLPLKQKAKANNKIIEFELKDAHSSSLLTGTKEIIALLSYLKLPCAIVTRNCRDATAIKLARNNINIDLVISREDHKAKPAPDALLYIAKQWQLPSENLLYVGDYLYDVQAAVNANMQSCLLTYGESLPYAHLATLSVNDLIELTRLIDLALPGRFKQPS